MKMLLLHSYHTHTYTRAIVFAVFSRTQTWWIRAKK